MQAHPVTKQWSGVGTKFEAFLEVRFEFERTEMLHPIFFSLLYLFIDKILFIYMVEKWIENQIKMLYSLWPSELPRNEISRQIGKSEKAIRVKASRLGVKRSKRIWTEEGLKRRQEATSRTFKGKKQGPNRKKVIPTEEAKRNLRNAILNNPKEIERRREYLRNYNLTKKDYSSSWNTGMHPWDWMKISEESFYKMIFEAQKRKPTSIERRVINIIDEHQLPYRYVGDGEIWIAGKCPDFINIDGEKKLIELQGDYWHTKEETQNRAKFFNAYGFETLFIWESEMKVMSNEEIAERITTFM